MKNLRMYINGKFCESRSGKWIDVLNPSTEEVISRQPEGTIEDVNEALDAAVGRLKDAGLAAGRDAATTLLRTLVQLVYAVVRVAE